MAGDGAGGPSGYGAAVHEFDADTAVEAAGEGRFRATITDRWHIGLAPNGGYLLAVVAAALGEALPHPDPLTITAHYLRPAEAGPAEVTVEPVRTGRSLSTATAALVQGGRERLRVLATCGDLDAGPARVPVTRVRGGPPDLPPPERCERRDPPEGGFAPPILERFDTRLHPPPGWVAGRRDGEADLTGWIRFADGRDADARSLVLFADAFPPAVFEVTEAGWVPTVELTVHVRARPAPGWLRARFSTRFLVDGWLEEDGELWDEAGRLVAQSRQLALVLPVPGG